jgi:hypothetical protein
MTIKEAAEKIANEYWRLRTAWFPAPNPTPPALLRFVYVTEDGNVPTKYAPSDWGYDHVTKVLQCLILEADLAHEGLTIGGIVDFNEDAGEANDGMYADDKLAGWAFWRWNLVHELCHEYEHVVLVGGATPDGRQLYKDRCLTPNQPPKWPPYYKHPVAFYSAIAAFAQHFGISRLLLHDTL